MDADVKAVREQVTDFVETLTTTAQEADDGTAAGAHLRVRIDDIANKLGAVLREEAERIDTADPAQQRAGLARTTAVAKRLYQELYLTLTMDNRVATVAGTVAGDPDLQCAFNQVLDAQANCPRLKGGGGPLALHVIRVKDAEGGRPVHSVQFNLGWQFGGAEGDFKYQPVFESTEISVMEVLGLISLDSGELKFTDLGCLVAEELKRC